MDGSPHARGGLRRWHDRRLRRRPAAPAPTCGTCAHRGGAAPRCEVHGLDIESGRLVGPAIDIDDCAWIGGPSATTDASRVAITYLASSDSMTVVLDGRSGTRLGSPIVGHLTSVIAPDGTLVGGGATSEVTQYDLDTLAPIGAFPGARVRLPRG